DTILKVSDLDITYRLAYAGMDSLRDIFIKAINNPVKLLFKEKNQLELLKGLNFELKKGERLGLLGVNGTGKTSLCRTIAGMHGKNPNIQLNGVVRAIFETSVVVQPELSGIENAWILTNLIYDTHTREQREAIVKDAVEFSELNEFIYTPFKHYSKGMKARLFLSIISARPCDLLIMDEVFSGADTFFNEKISKRVEEMIKDSGAVIFISHHNELIEKVCNRVIVLNDKNIAFDGSPSEGLQFYLNQIEGPTF
ncbi:MAG: ABC transporter ATP-binding protein, partial [Bacteriovoracaceae bacterium]|nr:ABC transporter ATP-binding protein [Bacteriovoracaceae bacterium]